MQANETIARSKVGAGSISALECNETFLMNTDSENLPQHLNDQANPQELARDVRLFRAGPLSFGVFASEVSTIADWREPTPLPDAPTSVLGVVGIQGRMLTVLDLPRLAGAGNETSGAGYRHIIALRGDEQLALAASEVAEIVSYSNSIPADPADSNQRFVLGVFSRDGANAPILNVAELFPTALQGRERRRRRF